MVNTTLQKLVKNDALYIEVVPRVNVALRQYVEMHQTMTSKDRSHRTLWQALETVISGGGKRLRPYLVAIGYTANASESAIPDGVISAAGAWEMLHQSMLIHDDVIDRDYIRHGQPNISGLYQQYYSEMISNEPELIHYADSAAILAGDLAVAASHQMIVESELSDTQKITALKLVGQAIDTVALGELQDTEAALQPVEASNPLLIAEMKSASYSFMGPLQLGAALAGASEDAVNALRRYGRAIGLAFQLRDDWLGVFGNPDATGKSVAGDIREGKRTLLIHYALNDASTTDRQVIQAALGNKRASDAQVLSARDAVERSGAKVKLEADVVRYTAEAEQALQTSSIPDAVRQRLLQLGQELVARDH